MIEAGTNPAGVESRCLPLLERGRRATVDHDRCQSQPRHSED
jgi:hypothetical protein